MEKRTMILCAMLICLQFIITPLFVVAQESQGTAGTGQTGSGSSESGSSGGGSSMSGTTGSSDGSGGGGESSSDDDDDDPVGKEDGDGGAAARAQQAQEASDASTVGAGESVTAEATAAVEGAGSTSSESNGSAVTAEVNQNNQAALAESEASQSTTSANSATPAAPTTTGDPVFISTGQYFFEDVDTSFHYGMNAYEITRVFMSSVKPNGSLGLYWASSLDTCIIRGVTDVDRIRYVQLSAIKIKLEVNMQSLLSVKTSKYLSEATALYNMEQTLYQKIDTEQKELAAHFGVDEAAVILNSYAASSTNFTAASLGKDNVLYVGENGGAQVYSYSSSTGRYEAQSEKVKRAVYITGRGVDADEGFIVHYCNGMQKWYDKWGLPECYLDRYGSRIDFVYDESTKKITSIVHNGKAMLTLTWGQNDCLQSVHNEVTGSTVSYVYSGRCLSHVVDDQGDLFCFSYDNDHDLVSITKPDGSRINIQYGLQQNGDGTSSKKVLATYNEEGYKESFVGNSSSGILSYTDADGNVISYTVTNRNQIVRESYPDGTFVNWAYNDDGDVVEEQTVYGTVTYEYNECGTLRSARYEDGSKEEWTYGAPYNSLLSYTDRDGVRTQYSYDANGSCVSVACAGKQIASFTVNSWGGVTETSGLAGKKTYSYTDRYKIASEDETHFYYDEKNRLVKKETVYGDSWQYTYSADGKIETCRSPTQLYTRSERNSRKDVVKIVQTDKMAGKTAVRTFVYDKCHHPLELWCGQGLSEEDAQKKVYLAETRSYSPAGKLVSCIRWNSGAAAENDAAGISYEYSYNGTGDVISNTVTFVDKSGKKNGVGYTKTYSYSYEGGHKCVSSFCGSQLLTRQLFDEQGHLVNSADGEGRGGSFSFSPAGRLLASVNAYGGNLLYTFDYSADKVSSVSDDDGVMTQYAYEGEGRVASIREADGFETSYTYEKNRTTESVIAKTPASMNRVTYDLYGRLVHSAVYDSSQKLVSSSEYTYNQSDRTCVCQNGMQTVTLQYDAWGNKTYSSYPETKYAYDQNGNISSVTQKQDGLSLTTFISYTANNLVSRIKTTDGREDNYYYNAHGDLLKHTDTMGIVWQGTYDACGRLVSESGRLLPEKKYQRDKSGLVKEIEEAGAVIEKREYSKDLRTVAVTDARKKTLVYTYDAYGTELSLTNRLGKKMTTSYDRLTSAKTVTGYNGAAVTSTYHRAEGMIETQYASGKKRRQFFDAAGSLVKVDDDTSTYRFEYNSEHQLSTVCTPEKNISYDYDLFGRTCGISSDDMRNSFSYDGCGRVLNASCNGVAQNFSYDIAGKEKTSADQYGNEVTREYDDVGRLILLIQKSNQGEIMFAEGTVYDENGRVSCRTDGQGNITTYEYDTHGRLTKTNLPFIQPYEDAEKIVLEECGERPVVPLYETAAIPSTCEPSLSSLWKKMNLSFPAVRESEKWWTEQFSYDENGNCLERKTPLGIITYEYDDENRLVSVGTKQPIKLTYDDNGNIIEKKSVYRMEKCTYTEDNRLCVDEITNMTDNSIVTQTYAYDPLGRRNVVLKSNGTKVHTLYDGYSFCKLADYVQASETSALAQHQKIRYRNVDAQVTANTLENESRFYLYVNGTVAAQVSSQRALTFCTDTIGTIRSVYNASNGSHHLVSYDAAGTPFVTQSTSAPLLWTQADISFCTDRFFCGKPYDSFSSSYNFGYRDYSTTLSRFTTADPARDGRNWYAYCNDDPINFFDPDGREIMNTTDTKQTSSNVKLGTGDETIAGSGCVLTSYVRIAQSLGYTGDLTTANDAAINHSYFTDNNKLSPQNGAKLINTLVNNPNVTVKYIGDVSTNTTDMSNILTGLQEKNDQYFVTVRVETGNQNGTETYEHTMNVPADPVTVTTKASGVKEKNFAYNDTSPVNRTGTDDKSRLNIPKKIDIFKLVINDSGAQGNKSK